MRAVLVRCVASHWFASLSVRGWTWLGHGSRSPSKEGVSGGSFGFRYPVAKDQTSRSLPIAPALVNLPAFHEALDGVANFLSGVSTELHTRLDYVLEMEAEAHQNYSPE